MNRQEAEALLTGYGQTQLLRFYDTLTEENRASLLKQISEIDFSLLNALTDGRRQQVERGSFAPLGALEVSEILKNREKRKKKCKR